MEKAKRCNIVYFTKIYLFFLEIYLSSDPDNFMHPECYVRVVKWTMNTQKCKINWIRITWKSYMQKENKQQILQWTYKHPCEEDINIFEQSTSIDIEISKEQ